MTVIETLQKGPDAIKAFEQSIFILDEQIEEKRRDIEREKARVYNQIRDEKVEDAETGKVSKKYPNEDARQEAVSKIMIDRDDTRKLIDAMETMRKTKKSNEIEVEYQKRLFRAAEALARIDK